ncbi:MAG: RluA family pseudouridine synthase [Longicatena sp.]
MREIDIIVQEDDTLDRIDKFVSDHEEDLSRNRIQGLLSEGLILVNEVPCKAKYKIKVNDHIYANFEDEMELEAQSEKMDLDIRYEDSDVIVINKPKGVVVHPANGNQTGTLVNGLLYHCKDLSGINGVLRPGIVHRIDKDTTGLLIVAKNDMAHASLSKQLQSKSVNRLYYALVHGVIEHEFGTIDAPIGRDCKDRQKMAVTSTNSKDARTHFKVLERFDEYTLVECRLETGRTHQIRVHMQYIGHPVVGDVKYSYRKTMQTNGQLLHAHRLTFIHPRTNEEISVEAPLPKVFEDVLEELRKK